MENIKCPICGQNNTEIIFTKGNLDKDLINVTCKNCSLVYINPRPAKDEYDKFHETEFLSEKSVINIGQVGRKLKESDLKIKNSIFSFLNEYLKEGQNVLDIGCGFGTLLDIIKTKTGVNVFGVELGNLDVAAAKEFYGLDVFHGSLEEFAKNSDNWNKFDAIVMHHVLEHLPEPVNSLEQIKKLLRPNGILYIGVPNTMNLKKRPEIFFQRAHPFSYSPYSLKLILEKVGFGILKFNKNAGYPGGMEAVAQIGKESVKDASLEEGRNFSDVAQYIRQSANKFGRMRRLRDIFLFFIPQRTRIKIGRFFHKIMKRGLNDRQFFKFIVLPSSLVAGFLFILNYIIEFIKVTASGRVYNIFSFFYPDPLIYYAPFVRAAYDGGSHIIDGRILENFYLPNLWTQLSPLLIAPLWHLTGSISSAWILGDFLIAASTFICFYFLCFFLIKNRIFSLLYSFLFISIALVFNYLFPTSIANLKIVGRVILPFGSPAADVLLNKYISFSVLPGFLFLVSSFLFILLAIKKQRRIYIVLAGLNLSILPYIVMTHFIYVSAALFCTLILFLFYKNYSVAKRIIWIYIIAAFGSIIYWINFLQIKMLPWSEEFYGRLGGEISREFRWSAWPQYIAYTIMILLLLYWGKKAKRIEESIFVAGSVMAAIIVLNMQVITGYNPAPSVWAFHQFYVGFALGWLILVYWIYISLYKRFNKKIVSAIFLTVFLMIMGKYIYMVDYRANIFVKYDAMPTGIYAPLEWLNENTEKDSVVATPSLAINALLPVFTHNNSMLPNAITSPMSLEDVKDRYFVIYKLFNVSVDYFEKALQGKLPNIDGVSFSRDNSLRTLLFFDYYCNHSLDMYKMPGSCSTAAALNAADVAAKEYVKYPEKREYLLNKYRIDYIYYGPSEKKMSQPDFSGFLKVYDKDGTEIYKRIGI